MKPQIGDLSLFTKHVQNQLLGLSGIYVDDAINCGPPQFLKEGEMTASKFESKPPVFDEFNFTGMYFKTTEDGFKISQEHYAKRLKPLPDSASFKSFQSARAQISWLSHTRPDL